MESSEINPCIRGQMTRMPRPFNRERTILSMNGTGETGYSCKRMKWDSYLIPYIELTSKSIKNLNVRPNL